MSDIKMPPLPETKRCMFAIDGRPATPVYTAEQMQAYARAAVQANVPDATIAGALFDFAGFLTTLDKPVRFGSTEEASPMVKLIQEFAKKRGLSLDGADVLSWSAVLSSAPPVAQPEIEAEAEPAEPTGYLVEGEHLGKVVAKVMYFTLDEAKSTASVFSQHYPTVHTKPLYTGPVTQAKPEQAQPAERKPLAAQQLDKAAKALAECMDYPWALMPEQGREQMRKNALAVIAAAHGIGD